MCFWIWKLLTISQNFWYRCNFILFCTFVKRISNMFKTITSLSKVIKPINCIHSCRLFSIPRQCQIRTNVYSTKIATYQYSPNLSVSRLCHTKPSELTLQQKLKNATKEYGSVLIVFHVGISLISLGTVYFFIINGVDVQQWIGKIGMSNTDESTKIVAGASQFIIAYAIHKSLAPIRISITLVSVPLIVRYLRAKGIMKIKK